MNKNILLECRNVVMGYDGAAVVNSVSFELERGDYLCIVGETVRARALCSRASWGLFPCAAAASGFRTD